MQLPAATDQTVPKVRSVGVREGTSTIVWVPPNQQEPSRHPISKSSSKRRLLHLLRRLRRVIHQDTVFLLQSPDTYSYHILNHPIFRACAFLLFSDDLALSMCNSDDTSELTTPVEVVTGNIAAVAAETTAIGAILQTWTEPSRTFDWMLGLGVSNTIGICTLYSID